MANTLWIIMKVDIKSMQIQFWSIKKELPILLPFEKCLYFFYCSLKTDYLFLKNLFGYVQIVLM